MARLVAQAFEHVAVAAGEVPDVARLEVVGLGVAAWIDDRGADAALEDERPLGGGGVPVQFAHRARLEPHRDAGDPLGDRQLLDGGFLAVAVADDLAFRLLQRELEGRQFLAGEHGSGTLFMKLGSPAAAGWAPASVASEAMPAAARNSRRCGSDMVLSLRASEMLRRPCDHRRSVY